MTVAFERRSVSYGRRTVAHRYASLGENLDALLGQGEWTPDRLSQLQETIAATVAKNRELGAGMRRDATFFIDSLEELCSANPRADIDYAIDGFEKAEDDLVDDKKAFASFLHKRIKQLSKSAPRTLVTLVNFKSEAVRQYNEMASIARDGRWKMMAMRSRFQPSVGAGLIHGSGEPSGGTEAA